MYFKIYKKTSKNVFMVDELSPKKTEKGKKYVWLKSYTLTTGKNKIISDEYTDSYDWYIEILNDILFEEKVTWCDYNEIDEVLENAQIGETIMCAYDAVDFYQ